MPFVKGKSGNPRGRQKGTPNKVPAQLKDMILQALDKAGGVEYLKQQSEKTPQAFLSLVGKVLPLQVTGKDGEPLLGAASVTFVIHQQPGATNKT